MTENIVTVKLPRSDYGGDDRTIKKKLTFQVGIWGAWKEVHDQLFYSRDSNPFAAVVTREVIELDTGGLESKAVKEDVGDRLGGGGTSRW